MMSLFQTHQTQKATALATLVVLMMAASACRPAATSTPLGDSTQLYKEGLTALDQGDYEQAVAGFTQAIQSDSNHAGAYYERANAYFILGNFEQAVADYSEAIKLNYQPVSYAYAARSEVNTVLGNYQQSDKDYRQAFAPNYDLEAYAQTRMQTFSRVIELNAEQAIGYYGRGQAYGLLNKPEAAIADCLQAIDLSFDPLSRAYQACGRAYLRHSVLYAAPDERKQAIQYYSQALELDPQAADIYFDRGMANDDTASAIADFQMVIKLDHNFAQAYNNLCWDSSLSGKAAEALDYCEQAVALDPNDPGFQDTRGIARALTGDFAGAIEDFQYSMEAKKAAGDLTAAWREGWIAELKAGRNPIDAGQIEVLLRGYQ